MKAEQITLFKEVKGDVHVYNQPSKTPPESKTELVNFKVEDSEKKEIANFCFEHDLSVSQFYRKAGRQYKKLYPYKDKVEKYWDAMISWLIRLP